MKEKVAIFIMPRSSRDWQGAEAMWVTVAGWAAAAKRKYGSSYVFTTDSIAQPEEVIHYPIRSNQTITKNAFKSFISYGWIPIVFKTMIKDFLLWYKGKSWSIPDASVWNNKDVVFIWQQHDLFAGPGRALANQLKVPLFTYVHAPQVWESSKWGVKRPLWGKFLEKFVESRSLKKSDLVGCVSEVVAQKLIEMGIDRSKIIVSPMAVDPYLFEGLTKRDEVRSKYKLENKIVIGWTGSFRSFHGIDLLVRAFEIVYQQINNARLFLVGDGLEMKSLKELVEELGLSDVTIFAGRKAFSDIPSYISAFDVALVSARHSIGFHYSPLKLREYLAASKAVVAPCAGEIPIVFKDNFHVMLYEAGNIDDLAEKLLTLLRNEGLRKEIARNGNEYLKEMGTWDGELNRLLKHPLFN